MAISLLLIEGFIPSWVLSLSITIIAILRAKLRIFGVKNARKNGDGGEVKSIKDFFSHESLPEGCRHVCIPFQGGREYRLKAYSDSKSYSGSRYKPLQSDDLNCPGFPRHMKVGWTVYGSFYEILA